MSIRGSFVFSILAMAGMTTLNVSTALFAEHKICILGNDVLRETAKPIISFNNDLKEKVSTMLQTLYVTGNGVGLAAPQIGRSERLVVVQMKMPPFPESWTEEQKEKKRKEIRELSKKIILTKSDGKIVKYEDIMQFGRFAFTNPEIKSVEEIKESSQEGCLSLPGIMADVPRYKEIKLSYQDLDGHPCVLECDGVLAQIIQHETDHLNGVLYVDRVSELCVIGSMPIWKKLPLLYERMKKLKDDVLTKAKLEELKQRAEQEGRPFQLPGEVFWISKDNKAKALEIIKAIGGEEHLFDYDTLLP